MVSLTLYVTRWRRWIRASLLLYLVAIVLFTLRTGIYPDYFNRHVDGYVPAKRLHIAGVLGGNYTRRTPPSNRHATAVGYFAADRITDTILLHMLYNNNTFCNGNFIGFNNKFARLYNAVIDPHHGHGRKGGENMSYVINQQEGDEYYKLDKGFFKIQCDQPVNYQFNDKDHLRQWMAATESVGRLPVPGTVESRWTMAIVRYEYVNLYHTMTDFYNAFLLIRAFSIEPDDADILWIDGHPGGGLDVTWDILFGKIYRFGELTESVKYEKLIWNIMGYNSPINKHDSHEVPYTEEFREFFLRRHGVDSKSTLNCANMTVLFLWRRDYVAHPRNPRGLVSRKVKNEDELLSSVSDLLPGHSVRGIQIDLLPMREQLRLISGVDILIGMHGAGLSHTLFLPKHAGLVELYPTYWSRSNAHFRTMSRWRNMKYSVWVNADNSKELPNHYTIVDAQAVVNMVHEMNHNMCGDLADKHE